MTITLSESMIPILLIAVGSLSILFMYFTVLRNSVTWFFRALWFAKKFAITASLLYMITIGIVMLTAQQGDELPIAMFSGVFAIICVSGSLMYAAEEMPRSKS